MTSAVQANNDDLMLITQDRKSKNITVQKLFENTYNKEEIDSKLENLDEYENKENKTSTISETSTNEQYPSAKDVYDYIQSLDGSEVSY